MKPTAIIAGILLRLVNAAPDIRSISMAVQQTEHSMFIRESNKIYNVVCYHAQSDITKDFLFMMNELPKDGFQEINSCGLLGCWKDVGLWVCSLDSNPVRVPYQDIQRFALAMMNVCNGGGSDLKSEYANEVYTHGGRVIDSNQGYSLMVSNENVVCDREVFPESPSSISVEKTQSVVSTVAATFVGAPACGGSGRKAIAAPFTAVRGALTHPTVPWPGTAAPYSRNISLSVGG